MQLHCPALTTDGPIQLGLGAGPGPRLLSPGAPDRWVPCGGGLAWIDDLGLFWLNDENVQWWPIPGTPISIEPWGWGVGIAFEVSGALFWAELAPSGANSALRPSSEWMSVGERMICTPHASGDLLAPSLPLGARDAYKTPLQGRPGLAWLDSRTVYRGNPRDRICVAGSVDFEPDGMASGPKGSLIIWGEERHAWVPPEGPPMSREGALEPWGFRLLSSGLGGWGLVDGETCALGSIGPCGLPSPESGCSLPLGTPSSPWALDIESGALASGTACRLEGVFATAWSMDEALLVGPGGGVWDAQTGSLIRQDRALCGEEVWLTKQGIVVEIDEERRCFNRAGKRLGEPIFLTGDEPDCDAGTYQVAGGVWHLGWDGLAIWQPH
jgi:hypothetical protein